MKSGLVPWHKFTLAQELYATLRGLRNAIKYNRLEDQVGTCNVCGRPAFFRYRSLFTPESPLMQAYPDPVAGCRKINALNSLDCSWCLSKFRVRAATAVLLKYVSGGACRSLKDFCRTFGRSQSALDILETASSGGIFSDMTTMPGLVRTEYFRDVPRGAYRDGVRSEDLEALTFADKTFDVVISLDVFEHIAHPWQAFSEVARVLKPHGVAFITVPMDRQMKKTRTRALLESGQVKHLLPPVYHLDPLDDKGVLVFTDFGLDVTEHLKERGIDARLEAFSTKKQGYEQFVLVLRKL